MSAPTNGSAGSMIAASIPEEYKDLHPRVRDASVRVRVALGVWP